MDDSWMREYNEALKLSEDISGLILERNKEAVTGPKGASAIRRKITILGTRLDNLQTLLSKIHVQRISEKEMNRRKDMIENLRSKANQMATASNMSNFANRDSLLGPEIKPDYAMSIDNQEQYGGLEILEETLMSTKHIALSINEELSLQKKDDLDYLVDVTESRLQKNLAVTKGI